MVNLAKKVSSFTMLVMLTLSTTCIFAQNADWQEKIQDDINIAYAAENLAPKNITCQKHLELLENTLGVKGKVNNLPEEYTSSVKMEYLTYPDSSESIISQSLEYPLSHSHNFQGGVITTTETNWRKEGFGRKTKYLINQDNGNGTFLVTNLKTNEKTRMEFTAEKGFQETSSIFSFSSLLKLIFLPFYLVDKALNTIGSSSSEQYVSVTFQKTPVVAINEALL